MWAYNFFNGLIARCYKSHIAMLKFEEFRNWCGIFPGDPVADIRVNIFLEITYDFLGIDNFSMAQCVAIAIALFCPDKRISIVRLIPRLAAE